MNLLFSGIGGPTPRGLAKSVKSVYPDSNCIGVDASPWAPNLYQSDVYDSTHCIPNANDLGYWKVIEDLVVRESIDFAFIVPETEVLIWAERALTHSLPCAVHIPDWKIASFCFDKFKVAELLYGKGLAPRTVTVDVQKAIAQKRCAIDFPCWVRIKSGAGALGALQVNSMDELVTWLSLNSDRTDFIASPYLPGRNFACKMLYRSGKLVQSASAERIDYLLANSAPSGISGMCSRGRLLNRPDLVSRSIIALQTIADNLECTLHGMFTIDYKEDKSGLPLITEINIRHVSFNEAFALAGVNFAVTTLEMYLDLESQLDPKLRFEAEDYFIRGVDAPLRLVSDDQVCKKSQDKGSF